MDSIREAERCRLRWCLAVRGEPEIIIEVKTTDAYTVRLETTNEYKDKLVETGQVSKSASILIVVGREDTGALEAQVRGSRFAWDIRLISVERLIKLCADQGEIR